MESDRNASHSLSERLLRRPPLPRRGWPRGGLKRLPLGAFVASVVLAGLFLTTATTTGPYAGDGVEVSWPLLAGLTAAAIALERTRTELFGVSRVSLSFVPLFATGILFGPGAAGATSFVAILAAQVIDRPVWYRLLFNAAVVSVSGVLAAVFFYLWVDVPTAEDIVPQLAAALGAALVAFWVNSLLVSIVVAVSSGQGVVGVWSEKFSWLLPHYVALGLCAYAMAMAYLAVGGVGAVIFAVPVLALWYAVRQYTTRTRADVRRLQAANQALSNSEERFRSLVQHAPGLVAVINDDNTLQYISPDSRRSTARPGARLATLVHPEDLGRAEAVLNQSRANVGMDFNIEVRLRHPDGGWRDYSATITNLLSTRSVGGIVVNARDITERKALEDQLRHQAFHDPLTMLPNRALFMDRLEHALESTVRRQANVAVMFLDLDRFKFLNDSLGHHVGDELLVAVAERMARAMRPGDTVARWGGDEFTILCEDIETAEEAMELAERLCDLLREPVQLAGHNAIVTASVGVALSGPDTVQPRELIRSSDIALFHAKEEGRSRCVLFDKTLDSYSVERLQLETDLRQAVVRDELRLHFMPEVDMRDGSVAGFEALVRWEHPIRGLIPPADFIGMAEETGEILPIGQWVLTQACLQAQEWREGLLAGIPFTMSVNLSVRELVEPDVVWRVASTLRETRLDPSVLRIEITESVLIGDEPVAERVLADLKRLGVQLAIDDFGTGYSSLNYLRRLPVDVLKIDRSFVAEVDQDAREAAVVRAVVNLAEVLGLEVTVEGIEREEQREVLLGMGCHMAQGYYFSPPRSAEVIEQYVQQAPPRLSRAS
ncbi:MAG: EAL domain-containing protein [Dehalococcoidia bacterium]|nr:EAL domain-containing protein [Dehalococcoidia bacterium]